MSLQNRNILMNLLNIVRNYYYIINMKIKKGKRLIAGLAFIGLTIAQSDVVAADYKPLQKT